MSKPLPERDECKVVLASPDLVRLGETHLNGRPMTTLGELRAKANLDDQVKLRSPWSDTTEQVSLVDLADHPDSAPVIVLWQRGLEHLRGEVDDLQAGLADPE